MGIISDDFGPVWAEVRLKSFVINTAHGEIELNYEDLESLESAVAWVRENRRDRGSDKGSERSENE